MISKSEQEELNESFIEVKNLYLDGKLVLALTKCKVLENNFSDVPELQNLIGAIQSGLGNLKASIFHFSKAIQIKPNYAIAFYNLGKIKSQLGKIDEALGNYSKAILFQPYYCDAHFQMGKIFLQLSNVKFAKKSFAKALACRPNSSKLYNNVGIVFYQIGLYVESIEFFYCSLSLKNQNFDAYFNLGNSFTAIGQPAKAVQYFKRAIRINPDSAKAYNNLGFAFNSLAKVRRAKESYIQALKLEPTYKYACWNLHSTSKTIQEAKEIIQNCLKIDSSYIKAQLTLCFLKAYEGDFSSYQDLLQSPYAEHPYTRSFRWILSLPKLPNLYFNRWHFFDSVIKLADNNRPFYEFGVWQGLSFKYLIKSFKRGYGFDTFEGLPEKWNNEPQGKYSSFGKLPNISKGIFVKGEFEKTLPKFFSKRRSIAALINFDSDLYSSTLCALRFSRNIIDSKTILIFDQYLINDSWEQDEFKAFNEFCKENNFSYEVVAVSFYTKQVALKIK